ncbi:DEAD/DEAH box helicase [Conexibacter sp. W3-3-2]|uniref:type I restriction endonuclease subunit R n=1 Tax=Conexibacter sp. W3-3-2 TaxID=2675227 RepID=UPI0012B86811|nr:DEAD/DEAH box helicase family protein [Conexibacter sp. W3-3-2]MTD44854.1 DEAD/DEAH box helicase [Conexibacter sp. W3-3-2]
MTTPGAHVEEAFEAAIEAYLLAHGWYQGANTSYDRDLALDTVELFTFIGATQIESWEKLVGRHGGDQETAQKKFKARLTEELNRRGVIDLLRHGVTDLGVTIDLAYFRPAHGLTPALEERYQANRCAVTRQLRYAPGHDGELDLALFVNGLPVATAELKNHLTGQTVEHAKKQYRTDRSPKDLMLSGRRAVAHFAVDPALVFMTTRLQSKETRFLPFNKGTADGGAGNPPNPSGHRTAYLWEEVWQRDNWLDLLHRFVHVEPGTGKGPTGAVIFPRYHQWDAVRRLVADARSGGAGRSYLVQHSAGSGKSNTIAWTAHQLSNVHDVQDRKVFDKVVVITDRVVLDRQLQDTIFQFDHKPGVVKKIDKNSAQLAAALTGGSAQVVITTLQKFPVVLRQGAELKSGRYAVIVDEAHSSQTGEAAKDLKRVLGASAEQQLEAAAAQDAAAESATDAQDDLAAAVAARGRQENLSFFAFTATPKARTLELFGTPSDAFGATDGKVNYGPFHVYSMKQAIEEGFILDVLKGYATYGSYWKIASAAAQDPDVDKAKAAAQLARFVSLHPTNLAQKAEVIIEHFRAHTRRKIGGQAKAMVVTRSRLHAVRYKLAIDQYIREQGYDDLRTLVAFSGTVEDDGGPYTESQMNGGLAESALPVEFAGDGYQLLIVAEKYQTGFDQPLLHTMYVDKKLEGVKAVQTLSRLNRIYPGKTDTFVLDFANDTEQIQDAFAPFFEATIAEPTDPNLLYNAAARLDEFAVIDRDETATFTAAFLGSGESANASLYAQLDPAIERYAALADDDLREGFRAALTAFVRVYAFLAQIVPFADPELEQLYTYSRFLALRLPREQPAGLDLADDVVLTHLRTELIGEHDLSLTEGGGVIPGFTGEGTGGQDPQLAKLSEIIDRLNERFGTEFTEADKVFVDQIEQTCVENEALATQARVNTPENFKLALDRVLEGLVIDRLDANQEFFGRMIDDPAFGAVVREYLAQRVYGRLNDSGAAG